MLEAVLAVGISGLFVSALLGYMLMTGRSTDRAQENTIALWFANEGLDAVRTINFSELNATTTGSLDFANNQWTLGTSGPQTLLNGLVRTIEVANVSRDAECMVVSSGGTEDPDSKIITSIVAWTDSTGRTHDSSLSLLRTNWQNPTGSCFTSTQSTQVDFNISNASFSGGKQLRDVYFTNNGSNAVTVDKLSFTWNNGALLSQMFMGSTKVWSSSGPGTPTNNVPTGTVIDIADFVLNAGATIELNKGQFNIQMSGTTLTMTVTFTDGSSWTSPSFNPI